MRYLTSDIVAPGLIISILLFCAIQLSNISSRLQLIVESLTVLTVKAIDPEIVSDVAEEVKKGVDKLNE